MRNVKKIKKHEKAKKDYSLGMSIKDIARKYKVKEATVRSWKSRYKWNDISVAKNEINIDGMTLNQIREELITQLKEIGKDGIQYIIEVDAYIDAVEEYYEFKRDLKERGYVVSWENGEQVGFKKNESYDSKNKASVERRKILTFLGLDNKVTIKDDDDEAL